MITRLFFVYFNNKNFNNEREFILSLRVHLIKLYIFLNDYIISYISFLKCKVLILLRVLLRFFFRDLLCVFRTLIVIIIKTLNQDFNFSYNFAAFEISKRFFFNRFYLKDIEFYYLVKFLKQFFNVRVDLKHDY